MRSLLDSILDNYTGTPNGSGGGPRVVSEVNDLGAVNWVAGMTDPGEMIACGAYQELRRLDGEEDAPYAARISAILPTLPEDHRKRIEAAGRDAATARHGLDTTGGKVRVMVAGAPGWHGLGVNVAEAVNSEDAERLSGLDFAVEKVGHSYTYNGQTFTSKEAFSIIRADSGAELWGQAGPKYTPIQNREAFKFLDAVMGEFGARFHTAGSIHGGRMVWMQVEIPSAAFRVTPKDEVQTFATFTNPHNGGQAWAFPSTLRIVCANTYRTVSRDRCGGLGIRHTGDVNAKVRQARAALGIAVRDLGRFGERAQAMVQEPCDAPEFFGDLLDHILKVNEAREAAAADPLGAALAMTAAEQELREKKVERLEEQRAELLADMMTRYESERCGIDGIRGSKWAAFNAVTESVDHRVPKGMRGTLDQKRSRLWESNMVGDGDRMKQTAFEMLTVPAARA